jgi:putative peptidoglycan lipid II flippase
MREGWRPAFSLKGSPRLREIYRLMLPGLAGTAIFQVNVVLSRTLAFGVDEAGVAVLYLANRLMEFPLGIFTIAVATVIFPLLSRHAIRGEREEYAAVYRQGLRLILLITLPAAAGICVLSGPILGLFFQWGAFGAEETAMTVPVLAVFALTLPLYSIATFATRGFHSLKNTATPVRIAGWSFLVNLGFSLALMNPFGMVGLALANLISILFQSYFLQWRLARTRRGLRIGGILPDVAKMALAMGVMVAVLAMALGPLQSIGGGGKSGDLLVLGTLVPGGMAVYLGLVWLMRVEGRQEAGQLVRRLGGRFLPRSKMVSSDQF